MFKTKQITGNGSRTILMQDQNGPCALVALVNTLVLGDTPISQWLSGRIEVSASEIATRLGEQLDDSRTDHVGELGHFLPQLTEGLDVNPKFDGTFAPSRELAVFNAFGVPLIHGWVLGELEASDLSIDNQAKLASEDYEHLEQLQISDDTSEGTKHLRTFIDSFKSQISPSGIAHIYSKAEKPAVLFWNNHFSTVQRHNDKLYLLVTDEGYIQKSDVVWEELNLFGAGQFVDGEFVPVSLEPDTSGDAELARQLELEEQERAKTIAARRAATYKHVNSERGILDKSPEAIYREISRTKKAQKASSSGVTRERTSTPDIEDGGGKKKTKKGSGSQCTIC